MAENNKFNFTKRDIQELEPAPVEKQQVRYLDTKERGLYLLVTSTGVKSFYVRRKVLGKSERLFLGRFPEMSIEQARSKAAEFHSSISKGNNLAQVRREELGEMTLGELFGEYIQRHAQKSCKTWKVIEQSFERDFNSWKTRKLSAITSENVEKLHGRIAQTRGQYAANRALELIRAIYNKGIRWKLFRGDNPAVNLTPFKEETRVRILQPNEFEKFIEALELEPDVAIRDFIMLSLLTGARKANLLSMRWTNINMDAKLWFIPGEETKNGRPHAVPLTERELSILRRRFKTKKNQYVFYGEGATGHLVDPKRAWKRVLKSAGIIDLHLHDLRRSMASWMANTGANVSLIQSALNHKDVKTTLFVYAHTVKDSERDAREKAHDFMLTPKNKNA
ncbi:site-specific integrase [soil metagenome]